MNARLTALLALLLVPLTSIAAEPDIDLDEFAMDVTRFKKVRQDVGLPEHLLKPDAKRTGRELDLNKYFGIFESLRVKPHTALDWVYSYDNLGGRPLLYTRNQNEKPFGTSAEFVKAVRDEAELEHVEAIWESYRAGHKKLSDEFGDDPFAFNKEADAARDKLENELEQHLARHPRREYWKWWRESIRTDGSPQSYLELAALYLLADQFALRWHSRFNDLEVLPNKAAIKERLGRHFWEWEGKKEFIPEEVSAKAMKLDPTPRVRFADNTVEVTLLTFTKWGGFQRKTLVISKTAPYLVKSETDKTEVEWDCGIMY
jgi:hypothetical protein